MRRPRGRGDAPPPGLRLLLVGLLLAALLPGIGGPVLEATEHTAGSLDPSFADDGVAITEISSIVEPVDAELQVVGGQERLLVLDGPTDDRVWRFLPGDGALDTTFGDNGLVVLDGVPFLPRRLAVGPDGSFVVGGFTDSGTDTGVRVARFLPNGESDPGFGTGGVATVLTGAEPGTDACAGTDLARTFTGFSDIGVQSDGAVVVTGPGQVAWDFGGIPCEPTDVLGLVVARLATSGTVDRVRGDAPCSGLTVLAEPRSMTIAPDDRAFVSTAFQCEEGPDPITVFRFSADLDDHVGFSASAEHPTDDRRLPIVLPPETTTVAVAARDPDGGVAAWNLLRWNDMGGSFTGLTSVAFPPGVTSSDVVDLAVAEDGSYVMTGHAVLGAERPSLALATFGPDGAAPPGGPAVVEHPGPRDTSTAGVALARLADGSFRVAGRADPDVFGLDQHRQAMLARLDGAGTFDDAFGPAGKGFVQHHGRSGDAGEGLAVLPDRRIVVAGRIDPAPEAEVEPTGFVLRHREGGQLDPGFTPSDLPGIEITRYPARSGSVITTALSSPAGVAASSVSNVTPAVALVQTVDTTGVGTEAELRAAFSDPDETHITLSGDISLVDCSGSFVGIARNSSTDLVIDGAGHAITQTCTGHRIITGQATGALTLEGLTLTGGNPTIMGQQASGGAVWTEGPITVADSSLTENVAEGWGGALSAGGGVTVVDSSFVGNSAAASGGGAIEAFGGDVTVTGSTFDGNTAGARGGAVWAQAGSISVAGSTFEGNHAETEGGALGALGAISVTASTFAGNTADEDGGGIWTEGDVTVAGSHFEDNQGTSGGAIRSAGGTSGGAPVTVIGGSVFRANSADGFVGGALYVTGPIDVSDSMFVDNIAITNGGAIFGATELGPERVPATVAGSVFDGNRVVGGGSLGPGDGGAIRIGGDISIDDTLFSGGAAAHGGAVYADVITASDSTFTGNTAHFIGGALHATEGAVITRSTFAGNRAGGATGEGGAIYTLALEDVTVTSSTFVDNSATFGGAIWTELDVEIVDSTFTRNASSDGGGAVWAGSGIGLTYVTIAGNIGLWELYLEEGVLTSFGSVIADGDPATSDDDCGFGFGVTTVSTYTYDTDGTCSLTGEGDATIGSPQLGSLSNNGGRTQTMLPSASSPLVGAIPAGTCTAADVTVDQRGVARPQGLGCDVGAVEVFAPALDIEVEGLDVDSRGRYVIAGSTDFRSRGAVHRLVPGGGSDPVFNGGVPVVFDLGDGADTFLHDVVVDGSDRIVAVGETRTFDGSVSEIVVVRLRPDGTPDPGFGDAGIVRLQAPAPDWETSGRGIAIDDAGRIVFTGWSQSASGSPEVRLLVARVTPSGALDASFGSLASPYGPGVALGPVDHRGEDVVTRGGDVLVAGTRSVSIPGTVPLVDRDGFLAKLTGIGQLDPGFGSSGIALPFAGASTGSSVARGLAVDAVGNVVVAGGSVAAAPGAAVDLLVARLLATGVPDPVFGTAGLVTTDTDPVAGEQAQEVAIAPDGKIVVTGHVEDDRGSRVLTARYEPGVTTLDCVPDVLDLGGRQLGTSTSTGVTCTATGGTAVITDLSVDPGPGFPADFALTPGTCQDATLFPGESCELTISFTPGSEGVHRATLNVRYGIATGPRTETVRLTGRGFRRVVGQPGFLATPDPLVFPERIVGTTSPPRMVTVKNVGDAPLGISELTVVGPHADDFTVADDGCDGLPGGSLGPDVTCDVMVVFSPGPGGDATRTAQLRFVETAPGSPHLVSLRGTVTAPALELDPDAGPVTTEVTATGTAFQPGVDVEIRLRDATVATVPGDQVTVDGFTVPLTVPEGTPGGAQDVRACQACDAPAQLEATAPFTVTPRLFVEPPISRPGGVVRARGDGFPANAPVTLTWDRGIGRITVTPDESGEFSVPVLVFRRDQLGQRELEARISAAEDVAATAPLLAVPGSVQPRDFAARR